MYSFAQDVSLHPLEFALRDRQIAHKTDNDVKVALQKAAAQAKDEGGSAAYAAAVIEALPGMAPLLGQAAGHAVTIGGALEQLDRLLLGRLVPTPEICKVLYLALAFLSLDASTSDIRAGVAITAKRSPGR